MREQQMKSGWIAHAQDRGLLERDCFDLCDDIYKTQALDGLNCSLQWMKRFHYSPDKNYIFSQRMFSLYNSEPRLTVTSWLRPVFFVPAKRQ